VLIADRGIRGLVLRCRGGCVEVSGDGLLRADAGVTLNGLIRYSIRHGLGGLEAWAGTPGTVGGGIRGNAHFGGRLLGEQVVRVAVASRVGEVRELLGSELEFGYDSSRLQRTGEVLLAAVFRVSPQEPSVLRETARRSLTHRKRTQPLGLPSAGCAFQNPDPKRDVVPAVCPVQPVR